MDTILQILQWAIPSGGIGAAIAWVANRKARETAQKKEVEETYKQMYDMVSRELVGVQKQNEANYEKIEELRTEGDKTRRALNRLSRAIESIQLCPYRADCPVRDELSIGEDGDAGKGGDDGNDKRQYGKRVAREKHRGSGGGAGRQRDADA